MYGATRSAATIAAAARSGVLSLTYKSHCSRITRVMTSSGEMPSDAARSAMSRVRFVSAPFGRPFGFPLRPFWNFTDRHLLPQANQAASAARIAVACVAALSDRVVLTHRERPG